MQRPLLPPALPPALLRAALLPSLALLSSLALACGSDNSDTSDASVPDANRGVCTAAATISSYPGTAAGNVLGAGADFNVEEGECSNEIGYFPQAGEDELIALTNLTPGGEYLVQLESDADLGIYIVTDCTGNDPALGECLLFSDDALGAEVEVAEFVAPASGTAYAVVDHFSGGASLAQGDYTLTVLIPQCNVSSDCDAAPNTPYCSDYVCVACSNSFHCDSADAAVCDETSNTCGAGIDSCSTDDAAEPGDDGPAGATVLVAPSADTPTVSSGNICSAPATETDYYSVALVAGANVVVSLDWPAGKKVADLDLVVLNELGNVVGSSFSQEPEVFVLENATAGTYFVAVTKYEPDDEDDAESVPYNLTLSIPECLSSFECPTAASPTCGPALSCIASTALCTGDTDDNVAQNDGPAEARALSSLGTPISAAICNTPKTESDYYRTAVTNGESLTVNVDYMASGGADLDIKVFNSSGTLMGFSNYQTPEVVELSFLPAGAYFVEVSYSGPVVNVAHPYTITANTPAGACTADADCAGEFKTQLYRGNCNVGTGACQSIVGSGSRLRDIACDSDDDCASGRCSYMTFQDAAELSVCTVTCNASSECLTAHGPGFSCTVPFSTNFCHPDCGSNLDCGALPGSATIDSGEPWDYLSCNAGACEIDN